MWGGCIVGPEVDRLRSLKFVEILDRTDSVLSKHCIARTAANANNNDVRKQSANIIVRSLEREMRAALKSKLADSSTYVHALVYPQQVWLGRLTDRVRAYKLR